MTSRWSTICKLWDSNGTSKAPSVQQNSQATSSGLGFKGAWLHGYGSGVQG